MKEASLAHISEEVGVTNNHRDPAYRLFAPAKPMPEDATDVAVAGQSSTLCLRQLEDRAHRHHTAVREIAVIAEVARIAVNSGIDQGRDKPERSRRINWTSAAKEAVLTLAQATT